LVKAASRVLGSPKLVLAARLILGSVFVYASVDKIAHPREFARVVVNYGVLPAEAAVYLAYVLPWLELGLGVLLVAGFRVKATSLGLSSLLVVFAAAVLIKHLNGGAGGCGCFSVGGGPESLAVLLGRDLALLACGLFIWGRTKISIGKETA
jgi:uncharacterized membrane protein YphA (DoxX/SURF4 family)